MMMAEGYSVESTTDYSIAVGKLAEPDPVSGNSRKIRATFDFAESKEGIRVYHRMMMITAPDSDKAFPVDMSTREDLNLQQARLNRIVTELASR